MLDSETKRRIDTARDILVGKVPDPKSQVEQITIALIYKFMDDMDAEAEELGGVRSFFVGEYEKFSWAKLLSPALGGYEMLSLYTEAVEKMTRNEGIPLLFRDIFKNAYLPYRDPETLKLFLKTINEFNYDHSEKLGDAFEYLLSVLGSQGDAGQFRTPRHIIDFMVKVVDPKKDDSILDPACGTAGFLISAYKHVLATNEKDGKPGGDLLPEERTKLANNIRGYDISPDMVRLSLVNLYLHGFSTPNIYEYDTLTSNERWNEYADVILANPPFMSPKGGIKPHKRFSVQSNRSEVLFVDYMAEHLTPNGRAAIIVPEGIIFQSAGAYKQLRKYLIESNYLWAVASLPAGVFNPYAGVKTSILFLDKSLAKKTDKILFVKIENDGFDLGAQRRPIDKNDLPDALNVLQAWRDHVIAKSGGVATKQSASDEEITSGFPLAMTSKALLVPISKLAETGDYNLSADRYREVIRAVHHTFPMVRLGNIAEIQKGSSITKNEVGDGNVPVIAGGQQPAYFHNIANRDGNVITVSSSGAYAGFLNYFNSPIFASDCTTIKSSDETKLQTYFLYLLLKNKQDDFYSLQQGMGQPHVYSKDFVGFQIPLPPLEIQRQIVDEIAAHQRIIDGARQIVEGWKPNLELELDENWEIAKLDDLCEIVRGSSPRPKSNPKFYGGNVPRLMVADVTRDGMYVTPSIDTLTEEGAKQSRPMKKGDLIMAVSGQPGVCGILAIDACIHDGFAGFRNLNQEKILTEFAYHYLMSQMDANNSQSVGAIFKNLNLDQLRQFEIPLPPLEIQREIVARIERERAIVEGNRELIAKYEEKVKKVIERVWEG